jgi:peroxiredoxin family protein
MIAVSTLATGAVAMGLEVDIFVTTWRLQAFRKGASQTNMRICKDFEEFGPAMMEAMQAKKTPSWLDTLKQAREFGDIHVFACSQTMELLGMLVDDLEDIVEDVMGAAGFVSRAQDSKIQLFI